MTVQPKPKGRKPSLDGSEVDAKIVADWQKGFGNAKEKVSAYQAGTARLKAVAFTYGTYDSYAWIPKGTVYVAEAMKAGGIPVSITPFECGHGIIGKMLETTFVPTVVAALGK